MLSRVGAASVCEFDPLAMCEINGGKWNSFFFFVRDDYVGWG